MLFNCDMLVGWLMGMLPGWLVDMLVSWLTGTLVGRWVGGYVSLVGWWVVSCLKC